MKYISTALAALALMGAPALAGQGPAYAPDLLPPSPQAGKCYARVVIPARHRTVERTVMTEAPYQESRVRQPRLETRRQSVLVKEASTRFEVRQPTYRTVTEQILTRPAYERLAVTRPQFSTVTEHVRMSEPQLVWKKGNPGQLRAQGYVIHSTSDQRRQGYGRDYGQGRMHGSSPSGDAMIGCGPTCEIWCLVEEPGASASFTRRVMSALGGVTRQTVPAQFQTVSVQVLADPGGVREIPVPAEYRDITVQDVVDAGGEDIVSVPPKYGRVQSQVMVAPERYEWREVLCQPGTQDRSGPTPSHGRHSGQMRPHTSQHSYRGYQ